MSEALGARMLSAWRARGLAWRIVLPVVVVAAGAFVAHVWLHLHTVRQEQHRAQAEMLDELARLLSPLVVERVRHHDLAGLARDIRYSVDSSTAIRSVVWRDVHGTPVVVSDAAAEARAPRWFRTLAALPPISRTYRLEHGNVQYGELTLVLSPEPAEYRLWRHVVLSASGGLLLFLLLTGAIVLVSRSPLRAIRQLGQAARQLARGTAPTPIAIPSATDVRDVVVAFNDMGARIAALLNQLSTKERTLGQQLHFAETLIDAIPLPVFYKDRNGRYLGVNRAWEQFFKMPRDQIIGRHGTDLYPQDAASGAYDQPHEEAVFASPGAHFYESRVVLADGSTRDVLCVKAPFTTADGDVAGIIGALTDLTPLAEAQERAASAKLAAAGADARAAAMKEFVDHFSHEMRTPLAGIINLVELVRSADNSAKQREYLSHLYSAAIHVREMVNNVLDMAQLEAGRLLLSTAPFQVADLVAEISRVASALVAPRLDEVQLTVESRDLSDVVAHGDMLRLRQAVTNLLVNAIRRTPRGTISVLICCAPLGSGRIELRFELTECHAAEAPAGSARLVTPASVEPGGAGLGQLISRRLIEILGGTLTTGESPLGGTITTLTVPLISDATPVEPNAAPWGRHARHARAGAGIHVAVVDDDPLTRYYLNELLVQGGYGCRTACDRRSALALLAETHPSLAIIDYRLDTDDGLAFARELRARFPARQLPIVLLTADVSASLPEDWSQCVDAMLTKPVTPTELFSLIDNLAGAPAMLENDEPTAVLLDEAMLERVTRGITTPGFLERFLDNFVAITEDGIEAMRKALANRDYETVRRLAHRQKGSARQIGATALAAEWLYWEAANDDTLARAGTARLAGATAIYTKTLSAIAAYRGAAHNGGRVGGTAAPEQ